MAKWQEAPLVEEPKWMQAPLVEEIAGPEPQRRIQSPGIDIWGAQDVFTSYEPAKPSRPGFLSKTKKAWQRGGESINVDFLWHKVATGELDEATAVKADKEFEKLSKRDPVEGRNWLENLWLQTVQVARPMAEGQYQGMKYGAVGAGGAALAGQAGPQVLVPEEIVTVPGAYAGGQVIGSVKYWSEQGSGLVYKEARKQGLKPETARYAAAVAGPVYAWIEYSQVDKIIPGLGKIKGNILGKAIKIAKNTVHEIGEEGVQKVVTDGATSIGKLVEGKIDAADIPAETKQIAKNSWEEMKQAAGPMAMLQLPGAAVTAVETITEPGRKTPYEGEPGQKEVIPPISEAVDTSGLPPVSKPKPTQPTPTTKITTEMPTTVTPVEALKAPIREPEAAEELVSQPATAQPQETGRVETEGLIPEAGEKVAETDPDKLRSTLVEKYGQEKWDEVFFELAEQGENDRFNELDLKIQEIDEAGKFDSPEAKILRLEYEQIVGVELEKRYPDLAPAEEKGKGEVAKVYYHGTTGKVAGNIQTKGFEPKITNGQYFGSGVYLTPDKAEAANYGEAVIPISVNLKNPFILDMNKYRSVEDWYDEIQDDIEMPLKDDYGDAITVHTLNLEGGKLSKLKPEAVEAAEAITGYLQEKGHDGVIVRETGKPDEIVVFDPKQVSLAPAEAVEVKKGILPKEKPITIAGTFFHNTDRETAELILEEGFKVEDAATLSEAERGLVEGNLGAGVYLSPDYTENMNQWGGESNLQVKPKRPLKLYSLGSEEGDASITLDKVDKIKEQGYDGIIVNDPHPRSGGYQIVVFDPSLLKIESIVEDTDLSGVELAERKIESEIQAAPAEARAKLEGKGPLQASVGALRSPQLDAALQRASNKVRTTYVSQKVGKWLVSNKPPKYGDYYRISAGESSFVKGQTSYSEESEAVRAARYIAGNTKQPLYIWQGKTGFEISQEKPDVEHVQINPKGPGLTRAERAILSRQQIAEAEIAQEEKQKVGFKAGQAEVIRDARNKLNEFRLAKQLTDKHRQDAADIVRQYLPKEIQYRYIKRILEARTNKRIDNLTGAIDRYLDKAEHRESQRNFSKFVKDIRGRYRRGEVAFGRLPKKVADQLIDVLDKYDISKLSEKKQKQLESRDTFVKRIAAELSSGFEAMNEDFDKDATDMMVMGQRRIAELKRLSQTHIGQLDAEQIRYVHSELENLLKINDLKGESKQRRRIENLRTDLNKARQEVTPGRKEHVEEFTGMLGSARWIAVEGQANIRTLTGLSTGKDNGATKKLLVEEPRKANQKRIETYREFIQYFKSKVDGKKITWEDVRNLEQIVKVKIGGQEIEISRDSLLSIYTHTQADGNMRRLLNTKGLNVTTYIKNAAGLIQRKKMYRIGKPTLDELRAISELIPQKHKDLLESYFETNREKQAPAINNTSMEYQNYELARSDKYFHVEREIDRPIEGTQPDTSISLDMMGRYLPRTGGTARINIRPFSMEVMKSMQSDAAYSSMLIPLENARTLLANRHWRENMKRGGHYKALRELTTMFRRVQGLVTDQSSLEMAASGLLRNISKSILSARVSGGLVQTASIPAAFETIEPKYFVGKDVAPTPGQIKALKKLSPALWMRWEGRQFDYALGLVGAQNAFESMLFGHIPKTDKLLAPYTIGDEVAIWKIWSAAKRKISAETDLEKDSKEFTDKSLEILYEALDTQPQWDMLHRSSLTSNPNTFLRGMTMFMSARNAQYNVLIRAMDDYRKGRIGKSELSKRLSGVGMANVFVSVVRRLFRIAVKTGAIGLLAALGLRDRPKEKAKKEIAVELKKIPVESVFNVISLNAFGGIFNSLAYAAIRHHKYPGIGNYSDIRSGNMFADLGMDFMQLAIDYEQLASDIISQEKYKSGPKKDQFKWKQSAKNATDLTAQVMSYFFGLPYEGPKADFIWPAQAAARQTNVEKMTDEQLEANITKYTYKKTSLKEGQILGLPWKGREDYIESLRKEQEKRIKGASK